MSRKKLFKAKKFYICDPGLNRECNARFQEDWCGKECFCTTKFECAIAGAIPLKKKEYLEEYARRNGGKNENKLEDVSERSDRKDA